MVNFSQQLNQIGANPYIKPGVQDDAFSGLLKNVANLGINAYTGYQTATLENELETVAGEYFSQNATYSEGLQAGAEAGGIRQNIDAVWGNLDAGVDDMEAVNKLERGFQEKLKTYSAAMKQGRMTPDQLYARVISTTKEAIYRNPFLQDKLLKTTDNFMEMSGLGSYIKGLQKTQKEAEDLQAEVRKQDVKEAAGLGLRPFEDPAWEEKLYSHRQDKAFTDTIKAKTGAIKDLAPIKAAQFIRSAGPTAYTAVYTDLQSKILNEFNRLDKNGRPIPIDEALFNARSYAERSKMELKMAVAGAKDAEGFMQEPLVKDWLASQDKAIDSFIEATQKYKTKEELVQFITRQRDATRAIQENAVMAKVNLPAVEAFSKVVQNMPQDAARRWWADNTKILGDIMFTAASIQNGVLPPTFSGMNGYIDGMIDGGKSKESQVTSDEYNKMFDTLLTGKYPNLKTKIEAYDHLLTKLSDPSSLDATQKFDFMTREKMAGIIMEYSDSLNTNAQAKIEESGLSVQWEQLNNGDLHLVYAPGSKKDDAKLRELNQIYGFRMTKMIKSLAHTQGSTDYKSIFDEYYGQTNVEEAQPQTEPTPVPVTTQSQPAKVATRTAEAAKKNVTKVKEQVEKVTGPIKVTEAKDLYKPEPKLPDDVVKRNKELVAKQGEFIKQAERELVGEGVLDAPLKHLEMQERIVQRAGDLSKAYAEGKEPNLAVVQGKERMRASPKGKWVVYQEGNGTIRFYSPVEKVYVDVPNSDIPLLEKWFKAPVEKWKRWEKK